MKKYLLTSLGLAALLVGSVYGVETYAEGINSGLDGGFLTQTREAAPVRRVSESSEELSRHVVGGLDERKEIELPGRATVRVTGEGYEPSSGSVTAIYREIPAGDGTVIGEGMVKKVEESTSLTGPPRHNRQKEDALKQQLEGLETQIKALLKEHDSIKKQLELPVNGIPKNVDEFAEDYDPTVRPEPAFGFEETFKQESKSQYAVYLGDGIFTGLGGSPVATLGHTRVNFSDYDKEDFEEGALYHFTTNGVVQLSYPSQIVGQELEQVTGPVQIEVSNHILKSVNEFKKDIKLEVINVGQYNRVTGETKTTIADIYNMKKVNDPNTILVVTGTSRLAVEQASQLLAERGANVIVKVTNYVDVADDFEESVKEGINNINETLKQNKRKKPGFNIEDAAPDVIYYT